MRKMSLVLGAMLALLAGCFAHMARYDAGSPLGTGERRDKPIAPVFAGTAMGTLALGACLASPVLGWFWGELPPWAIVGAPLVAIDIPLSFVADLVFIPSDIQFALEHRGTGNTAADPADPQRPPGDPPPE